VVAFRARGAKAADNVKALLGIGIVADDVSDTGIMSALLLLRILKDNLERFEVGVDVAEDRVTLSRCHS